MARWVGGWVGEESDEKESNGKQVYEFVYWDF